MCGIVGYVGPREATRVSHRGAPPPGIPRLRQRGRGHHRARRSLVVDQAAGRIEQPGGPAGRDARRRAASASATPAGPRTGRPTDVNAHPHLGGDGVVAVVHNGVIENFQSLKQRLQSEGYVFRSATDTEVIAHLIASCLKRAAAAGRRSRPADAAIEPLVDAVQAALAQLQGTYGLAILFRDWPEVLIAARLGSPLVVGVGDGEHFLASDASPLAGYTDKIVYLADHELAVVTADSLRVIHRDQGHVDHSVHVLDIEAGDVDLGGYRALHAQGDLRAARVARQRHARPARPRRGHGQVRRPEPHAAATARGRPHRDDRLRHELARRPWWANT